MSNFTVWESLVCFFHPGDSFFQITFEEIHHQISVREKISSIDLSFDKKNILQSFKILRSSFRCENIVKLNNLRNTSTILFSCQIKSFNKLQNLRDSNALKLSIREKFVCNWAVWSIDVVTFWSRQFSSFSKKKTNKIFHFVRSNSIVPHRICRSPKTQWKTSVTIRWSKKKFTHMTTPVVPWPW